jgi:hypothetical protein
VFGAAGLVARAEVRRRLGSLLLLALIVAAVTAAVLATAISVAPVGAQGTRYALGVMTSPGGAYFVDVDRPIVLAGRLAETLRTE